MPRGPKGEERPADVIGAAGDQCDWCSRVPQFPNLVCSTANEVSIQAWYNSPRCDPICKQEIPKNFDV